MVERIEVILDGEPRPYEVAAERAERATKDLGRTVRAENTKTAASFDATHESSHRFTTSLGDGRRNAIGFSDALKLIKWPALIAGAGGAAQGVSALGAGVIGLTSALAPLSGLLAAYPALLGAFAQATGVVALANVDDLTAAVGGLNEKLDETSAEFKRLSPQAQDFARQLQAAKGPFRELQEIAQGPLFAGLDAGLEQAMSNFPELKRVVGETADELGSLAEKAGHFLGREGFGRDFEQIGSTNAKLLGDLGDSGFHLADALRHVMVSAGPLIDWLGEGVESFSAWIEKEAEAGRRTGELGEFFDKTRATMERVVSIGGSLADVLGEIFSAASPLGSDILKALDRGAEDLERWANSTEGQNSLRQFFEDARPAIFEAGRLLGDLTTSFFDLADTPGLEDLLHQVRVELLPALVSVTETTTAAFGPSLVRMLTEAADLFENLGGSTGPLVLFVDSVSKLLHLFNELIDAAPVLGQALGAALTIKSIGNLAGMFGLGGLLGGAAGRGGVIEKGGIRMGTTLGTGIVSGLSSFGLGAAITAALAAATTEGGVIDTIRGEGNQIGEKFGEAIAGGFGPKLERAVNQRSIPALRDLSRHLEKLVAQFEESGDEVPADLARMAKRADNALDRLSGSLSDVRDDIHRLRVGFHSDLGQIADDTEANMRRIERSFGRHSERGKDLLAANFEASVDAIDEAMEQGQIKSEEGLDAINDLIRKRLAVYGIKGADAEKIIKAEREGEATGLYRGGYLSGPGVSGDRHHTVLEDGEYVVNREAVKRVGVHALDAVNYGLAPRGLQQGGPVGMQAGGTAEPPGDPGYEVVQAAYADAVGAFLRRFNMNLTQGYNPSGPSVSAGHNLLSAAPSLDVAPLDGNWDGLFAEGLKWALSQGMQVGYDGQYGTQAWEGHGEGNHAHIDWGGDTDASGIPTGGGAAGAAAAIVKAFKLDLPRFSSEFAAFVPAAEQMNLAARALEKEIAGRVNSQAGAAGMPGARGPAPAAGGSYSIDELEKLWIAAGGPPGVAHVAAAVALAESGGNPRAVGPDTPYGNAMGLWQILGQVVGGDIFDPMVNARNAVKKYTDAGGWSPWEAYTNGNYTQFLAGGGLVGEIDDTKDRLHEVRAELAGHATPAEKERIEEILELLDQKGLSRDRRQDLRKELDDLKGGERLSEGRRRELTGTERHLEAHLENLRERLADKRRRRARKLSRRGLSPELRERIGDLEDRDARLLETIDIAQRSATSESGDGGSDYTQGEVDVLGALYKTRLGVLGKERGRLKVLIERLGDQITTDEKLLGRKDTPQWKKAAIRENLTKAKRLRGDARTKLVDVEGLTGESGFIFDVKMDLADLGVTPPDTSAGDENAAALADLYKTQALSATMRANLSEAHFGVFSQFFSGMGGLPFLGAFAAGTAGRRIGRDGLAYLHRDEIVTPDPEGPHGTQPAVIGGGGGTPPVVNLVLRDRAGDLVELVEATVDGRTAQITQHVDRSIGRRARQRAKARGR